jgi:HEAT repeats
MNDEHLREGEPSENLPTTAPITASPSDMVVTCPRCCRSTDSLKSFDVPNIACLFVYLVWNTENITACPSCMRRMLFQKLLISIPLSNVIFPFTAVIYLTQLLATKSNGHSDPAIANAHCMSQDEQLSLLQEKIRLPQASRKGMIVLTVVIVFIVAIWGGGYALKLMDSTEKVQGKTLTAWIEDLDSADGKVRLKAVTVLGESGQKARKAVPKLQHLAFTDEEPWVRIAAHRALRDIDAANVQ